MQQLYEINTRIDTVNSVANNLQQKWSELDNVIKFILDELADVKQYLMKESLLLHNFPLPPRNITSLEYSMYVADQINEKLPELPITISWEHISTAHYFPTKAKKSDVIILLIKLVSCSVTILFVPKTARLL